MAERVCDVENCGRPAFGKGYCHTHYYRLIRKPKIPLRMDQCSWCGERKPINQMRHPQSTRGKTPSTCHACREANPDLAWCDFHNEPHPRSAFQVNSRPIGVYNTCNEAAAIAAASARDCSPIHCPSCDEFRAARLFRGGRYKCATCRLCEAENPDSHWCVDCADWLPKERFTPTGKDGKFWSVRCKPCRTANVHGVTVKFILDRQGSSEPECACCGSRDFLKVDHDHSCCPTSNGCANCVRGYLCHECNTAEGLLRTPQRAMLLAEYMVRVSHILGDPGLHASTVRIGDVS